MLTTSKQDLQKYNFLPIHSRMRSVDEMATSHILSSIDPIMTGGPGGNSNGTGSGGGGGSSSGGLLRTVSGGGGGGSGRSDRNLSISLDDRDLWLRFQNLTNEMIVTKNGRYVRRLSARKSLSIRSASFVVAVESGFSCGLILA